MAGKRLLSAFFFVLTVCSVPAKAAGLDDDLRSKYQGKVVMLRNFYCGSDLTFDEQGVLQSGGASGAWTLCRDIRIKEIKIRKGKLRIKGQRIYLVRGRGDRDFLDVTEQEPEAVKKDQAYQDFLRSLDVSIEAQLPANEGDAGVEPAMNKLFYASEQEFSQAVPGLWKCFFRIESQPLVCGGQGSSPWELPEMGPVEKVGGKIKVPKAIYMPDPSYSDEARKTKYQGTIATTIVVDPTGRVRMIRVTRPLGMGLDEQAEATISTWKFDPAEKDGIPVAVQLNVEVSFHLY